MQLELIAANPNVLTLDETGLNAQQIDDTYSCDTIAMKGAIRGHVKVGDALYVNAGAGGLGGDERRWELHRLFTEEDFKRLYPDYPLYERYGDLPSPNDESEAGKQAEDRGFYCGLLVRKGANRFRIGSNAERITIKTKGYDAAEAAHQEWQDAGCPEWDVWAQDHMGGEAWSRPFHSRDEAAARASFAEFKTNGWRGSYKWKTTPVAVVLVDPNGRIVDSNFPPGSACESLVKAMSYFMSDWTAERQKELISGCAKPLAFGGVREDGWPNPTREAYEQRGDEVLEVAHEETMNELKHLIAALSEFREIDKTGIDPATDKPFTEARASQARKEAVATALKEIPNAIQTVLACYEDWFGVAGREIMKERAGITADTAPASEATGQLLLF